MEHFKAPLEPSKGVPSDKIIDNTDVVSNLSFTIKFMGAQKGTYIPAFSQDVE